MIDYVLLVSYLLASATMLKLTSCLILSFLCATIAHLMSSKVSSSYKHGSNQSRISCHAALTLACNFCTASISTMIPM